MKQVVAVVLFVLCAAAGAAEPRARDLGVPFNGSPGFWGGDLNDASGFPAGPRTSSRPSTRLAADRSPKAASALADATTNRDQRPPVASAA